MLKKKISFDVIKNCNYKLQFSSRVKNLIKFCVNEDSDFGKYIIKNNKELFTMDYFNGNSNIITIVCESLFPFEIKITQQDIEIKQLYIAEHLRPGFGKQLKTATPLENYYDNYKPAIFYGIWSDNDLKTLCDNKSLKIIIWSGGDINADKYRAENIIMRVSKNVNKIKQLTKVVHISKSYFIDKSLEGFGLQYIRVPYIATDFNMYKPVTRGNSIYIYTSPNMDWYYGYELYDKVVEKYKNINFIFACCKASYDSIKKKKNNIELKYIPKYYEKNELINKIYPQCFLGLRLTIHDGIANTVQELGLLGIRSVHNGYGPSCLNYETFDDICKHIDNEIKNIDTCDETLANEVRKYLTLPFNFYDTSFYK